MNKQIKLLIIEDNDDDALLIIEQFKQSGYEVKHRRVWTENETKEALKTETWDAITCDHNMPGYNSENALKVLKLSGLDLPFVIVSGSIEVTKAIAIMKAGANDYIFKNSLERLVTVVEREIREAQSREIRRKLELYQAFLVEAGDILFSSLDYHITIQGILNLVVPRFADCCIIDLFEDHISSHTYTSHIDKIIENQILGLEINQRFPMDLIQSHSSKLISQITESIKDFNDESSEHLSNLLGLGFNSAIFVPLNVRGMTIGAITFLHLKSYPSFDSLALTLAEGVAQRSAIAIDNASLYQNSREAIQLRDDFLMIASHELKTPITSLKLKLQTLLRMFQKINHEKLSDENIIASLNFIDQQIEKIIKLIEQLLNTSKISKEKIKLNRETVNLSEIIYELKNLFAEELKISGSSLEIDVKNPIVGSWDPLRIKQALMNLLSNAIKYGLGKPIKLYALIKNNESEISIEDQGIGIDKKDQSRIFKRFERAVSSLSYGGLGLGLYITQQIIEAHGGSIFIESELNKGSRFVVRLPLDAPMD